MALNDTVSYLKGIKFLQLTLDEKLQIKAKGRHCPNLTIEKSSVSKGKQYNRKFKPDIYEKHNWLTGCSETNKLYCFPCLLFGGESAWTKVGVKDLQHLHRSVKLHESSAKHLNNVVDLSYLGRTNIGTQLNTGYQIAIARHNEKVVKNRETLSKLVDVIKFCGKFELPLRGHDESSDSLNPGVFRGLVDLVSQFDSALKSHLESNSLFKGISKTVQNDILSAILLVCKQEIESEIKNAEFISIMTDETTDISEKSQVVITFRYFKNVKPVERFWGFFSPEDLTSETLAKLLQDELRPLIGHEPTKLICQTYDGAAVLSGVNSGVQARMRMVYSNAYFVHCYAHQLNLIVQKAASQNPNVRIFFASLAGIPSFFSRSPFRMSALEQVTNNRRIPRPSSTRWNFKTRTVSVVYDLRKELVECFSELSKSNFSDTVSAAAGLKRMMRDPDFLFWLKFFSCVMPHVEILYGQIQARNIDTVQIANCVKSFTTNIQKIRDACDTMDIDQSDSEIGTRRSDNFIAKRREAKEVCDVVLIQCQERFKFIGHLEASRLLEPSSFSQFTRQFPEAILNNVATLYPCLVKPCLKSQLEVLYNRPDLGSYKTLTELLQSFEALNLTDTFSELTKLVRILITTPMTTAESERNFSTLKRIKTFLPNTMLNERLNALAMFSIEKQMISEVKNFNKKVIDLFATSKNRRVDLIFK